MFGNCGNRQRHVRRFVNGHLLDQVLRKSGILPRTVHKENGTIFAEDMLLEFAASGHPIFRATTPLSRGQLQRKGRGKLSVHFTADQDTVDTIQRIILSVNQPCDISGTVNCFW